MFDPTVKTRRGLLKTAGTIVAGSLVAASPLRAAAAAAGKDGRTKLILLGTMGGPIVGGPRYQTSNVIIRDGSAYVIDCGYGVTEQLVHAGVPLSSIRDIFITHNHPDHNIELGNLVYFAWFSGHPKPFDIYGPPPLKQIERDNLRAEKYDIDIWLKDIGHAPMPPVRVHEQAKPGFVMQDENVKVTSALVHHPPVKPAFGYRFDMPDRSIVFSGDTTPVESVARLAKGADILVHEALYPEAFEGQHNSLTKKTGSGLSLKTTSEKKLLAHLFRSHSPVEEVGRIAAEAGVKTLVLSHLVPGTNQVTDAMWRAAAAKHFKGKIIVGRDLMVL